MAVIGVTGGIGSGKSTFCKILASELKASLFDADAVVRDLLEKDPEVRALVRQDVLAEAYPDDGPADRAAIRQLIFSNVAAKAALEAILHPRVRGRWKEKAAECRQRREHFLVEIPLLFETGAQDFLDVVVTVACHPATQIKRVCARGLSRAEAGKIIATQLPIEKKIAQSNFVVWNDGSVEILERQAAELCGQLLTQAP
jgi:dephospho-CoA kinase